MLHSRKSHTPCSSLHIGPLNNPILHCPVCFWLTNYCMFFPVHLRASLYLSFGPLELFVALDVDESGGLSPEELQECSANITPIFIQRGGRE